VQLSIFLIDLFVGTYRLSSHARLEAFVIQTKLNWEQPKAALCASKATIRKQYQTNKSHAGREKPIPTAIKENEALWYRVP